MPYADPAVRKEYLRKYYQKNKEKLDVQNLQWHREHPERSREIGKAWRERHPDKYREHYETQNHSENGRVSKTRWFAKHPNAVKEYRMNLREQVFEMYGHKCALCGFADKRALQLDHVQDDGAFRHYDTRVGSGRRRSRCETGWRDAVKAYRPDIYQILCANCNWIKCAEAFAKKKYGNRWAGPKTKVAAV